MSEKKFVTYEEFGAVGDGVTNDFAAIKAAHDYANENGLTVKAEAGKTYYISDTRINGQVEAAVIKTDTVWTDASFIIDDSVYSTHENYGMYKRSIFEIVSDYDVETIKDEALFEKILADGLNKKTKKIAINLGYPALLIPYNFNHKIYRRRGYGAWGGVGMHEVILVDKDGNIDEETPVMWDYNYIDYILVIRTDIKPITIKGGKFTTKACNTNCIVYDDEGKPVSVNEPYIERGLNINRSYVTIDGVEHYITDEISINRQMKGEVGPPYRGFFTSKQATHVTLENCVMTGRRCYLKAWAGLGGGTMGTYDLSGDCVNKIVFKNCNQSNFWVTRDENNVIRPAKEGDPGALLSLSQMRNDNGIDARMHWGVGGTNYCKNMEYIGCTLTRYDAHQGLANGKIIDSTVVAIALTGYGNMYIENSRTFAESHAPGFNRFFSMREDYGSTWEGNIYVKNFKAYLYTKKSSLQNAVKADYKGIDVVCYKFHNWYFGYDCHFPNVTFDGVELYDMETFQPVTESVNFNFMTKVAVEPGLHRKNTYKVHPTFPTVDADGDGLIDGTNIPYTGELWGGVTDESSYENLNRVVPPKYIKVLNNKYKYKYCILDASSYKDMDDGGFFGETEFITDDESFLGKNPKNNDSFVFEKYED